MIFTKLFFLFLTITALFPAGIDASVCLESSGRIDIHLSECAPKLPTKKNNITKIWHNEDHDNDLKLICAFDTPFTHFRTIKSKNVNSSSFYLFSINLEPHSNRINNNLVIGSIYFKRVTLKNSQLYNISTVRLLI